jgi:hypothetical protein
VCRHRELGFPPESSSARLPHRRGGRRTASQAAQRCKNDTSLRPAEGTPLPRPLERALTTWRCVRAPKALSSPGGDDWLAWQAQPGAGGACGAGRRTISRGPRPRRPPGGWRAVHGSRAAAPVAGAPSAGGGRGRSPARPGNRGPGAPGGRGAGAPQPAPVMQRRGGCACRVGGGAASRGASQLASGPPSGRLGGWVGSRGAHPCRRVRGWGSRGARVDPAPLGLGRSPTPGPGARATPRWAGAQAGGPGAAQERGSCDTSPTRPAPPPAATGPGWMDDTLAAVDTLQLLAQPAAGKPEGLGIISSPPEPSAAAALGLPGLPGARSTMIGVPASAVTREQLAAALQHLPTRPDPLGGLGNRLMVSAAPRCPAWATAGCRLLDARRTRARGPIHTPSRRPPPPQHPSPQPPQRNAPPQARGHHLTPPPPPRAAPGPPPPPPCCPVRRTCPCPAPAASPPRRWTPCS